MRANQVNRVRTRSQSKEQSADGGEGGDGPPITPSRKRARLVGPVPAKSPAPAAATSAAAAAAANSIIGPKEKSLQLTCFVGTLSINLREKRLVFLQKAQSIIDTTRDKLGELRLIDVAQRALDDTGLSLGVAGVAASSVRLVLDGKRQSARGILRARRPELLWKGGEAAYHHHKSPSIRLLLPFDAEKTQSMYRLHVLHYLEELATDKQLSEAQLYHRIEYCLSGAFELFVNVDEKFRHAYSAAVLDVLWSWMSDPTHASALSPVNLVSMDRALLTCWYRTNAEDYVKLLRDTATTQQGIFTVLQHHQLFLMRYRAHAIHLLQPQPSNHDKEEEEEEEDVNRAPEPFSLATLYPFVQRDGFLACEYMAYIVEAVALLPQAPDLHLKATRALAEIHKQIGHHTTIFAAKSLLLAVTHKFTPSLHHLVSQCLLLHLTPAELVPPTWFYFLHGSLLPRLRAAINNDNALLDATLVVNAQHKTWKERMPILAAASPQLVYLAPPSTATPPPPLPFISHEDVERILSRLYYLWTADERETRLSSSIEWSMRYLLLTYAHWPALLAAYHVFFTSTPYLFRETLHIDTPHLRGIYNPLNEDVCVHPDVDLFRAVDFSSVPVPPTPETTTTTTPTTTDVVSWSTPNVLVPHILLNAMCSLAQCYHSERVQMNAWATRTDNHEPLSKEMIGLQPLLHFHHYRPIAARYDMTSTARSLVAQLVQLFFTQSCDTQHALLLAQAPMLARLNAQQVVMCTPTNVPIVDERRCVSSTTALSLVARHIEQPFVEEALRFLAHALVGVSRACFTTTALHQWDTSQLPRHTNLATIGTHDDDKQSRPRLLASRAHNVLLIFIRCLARIIRIGEARYKDRKLTWSHQLSQLLERHSYVLNLALLEKPDGILHRWKFLTRLPQPHRLLGVAFRERMVRNSLFSVHADRVMSPQAWSQAMRDAHQPPQRMLVRLPQQAQQQQQQGRIIQVLVAAPAAPAGAAAVNNNLPSDESDADDDHGHIEEEEDEEDEFGDYDGEDDDDENDGEVDIYEEEAEEGEEHEEVDTDEEMFDAGMGGVVRAHPPPRRHRLQRQRQLHPRHARIVYPAPGLRRPLELSIDRTSIIGSTLGQLETLKFDDISAGFQVTFKLEVGGTCAAPACKRAGPFPPFTPQVYAARLLEQP
jgi:hypothetical protein